MKKLFLDDHRTPNEFVGDIYDELGWHIVSDYNQFVSYILENGVPDIISFDHDLVDEHYDIDWSAIYISKRLAPTTQPTGLECAIWVYKFCQENKVPLPKAMVHSMNPLGRKVIQSYIDTW